MIVFVIPGAVLVRSTHYPSLGVCLLDMVIYVYHYSSNEKHTAWEVGMPQPGNWFVETVLHCRCSLLQEQGLSWPVILAYFGPSNGDRVDLKCCPCSLTGFSFGFTWTGSRGVSWPMRSWALKRHLLKIFLLPQKILAVAVRCNGGIDSGSLSWLWSAL